jgi:predicted ATPase
VRVLKKLIAKNFKCLRDVELDLEPLTVLVGPNGSGKSTVLEALNPWTGLHTGVAWQREATSPVAIGVDLADGTPMRSEAAPGTSTRTPQFGAYQRAHLDVGRLRAPNKLALAQQLDESGSNLANLFATLTRSAQASLAKDFVRLVPIFSDVDTVPLSDGHHTLRFHDRWARGSSYSPAEVSDGSLLVLAFLALRYQTTPPDLLAIEEPERGLHPYLLEQLIGALRTLTVASDGRKSTQVILATHSAELLEIVEPHEIRFLNRDRETGGVRVRKVDPQREDFRAAYEEYAGSLGSLWLSGNLGGVPGA